MYILTIARAIKKMTFIELRESLSLETMIKELNLLKKAVMIQWNV